MSKLAKIQQEFMQYLLFEASPEHPQSITHRVAQQTGISAQHRLEIYANAYRTRLTETLETDHQILALYLGDELFDKLSKEYIQTHPSATRSLRHFCNNLTEYLRQDAFFSQYPILADIAEFERRLLVAFDAADADRIGFEALQHLPPEYWPNCQLRFHPSVQVFSCQSNAVESWQALKADTHPDAPYYKRERHWLLWRNSERLTQFESLTVSQHALLTGFIAGQNFAQQCELMLNWYDEHSAPAVVLQTLQDWFKKGMIRSLSN
ncbi:MULTISPECIES: DNA-binding domain-containing protein [Shewanella]|uniref:HvfC/BufC N-terminal domain-containing protein n=1 Tax=Shewanella TaxID=22 RepID=UPI000E70BEB7|nr:MULTISPECIES: DNA-binding domain-containing protein [Shewanella]